MHNLPAKNVVLIHMMEPLITTITITQRGDARRQYLINDSLQEL
jgi:hypothetical protein